MTTKAPWARLATFAAVLALSTCLLLVAFHYVGTRSPLAYPGHTALATAGTSSAFSQKADGRWTEAYGKLPLAFERNVGQTDPRVRFVSRGSGYQLFLTSDEAVLSLHRTTTKRISPVDRFAQFRAARSQHPSEVASVLRMRLAGANTAAEVEALDELPGEADYYIGNDPKKWHTGVPSFARVRYRQVYPGVDVVFYGNQRRLEYDFVVAPGADPKTIALDVSGAGKVRLGLDGNVVMSVRAGDVELQKPAVYQETNGQRREIAGNYAVSGKDQIRFAIGDYDRTQPLIIDPILSYSTYLGGSADDFANGIAVDSSGDAWVAGGTTSTDFPSAGTPPTSPAGTSFVFVAELNPGGTALLYSAYLTGSTPASDQASAIALDGSGNVYVTGTTYSVDFPGPNGLTPPASAGNGVAFLTVINRSLPSPYLAYTTLLGGAGNLNGGDLGLAVAADAAHNAYVTGLTHSTNFPTQGSITTTLPSPYGSAFVTRIDTTKTGTNSLIYSTYLGGTGSGSGSYPYGDAGWGIAADTSNNAYVVGITSSTDLPTTANALQATAPATVGTTAGVFVARVNTAPPGGSSSLTYLTYLLGSTVNGDFGYAIALGPNNVAYVTGTTLDPGFPAPTGPSSGAYQTTDSAQGRAFVTLIDTTKSGNASLKYSTYLGGSNGDTGFGIAVDSQGNAYIGGSTNSPDFPVTGGALQFSRANTHGDPFVAKLNPAGAGASDLIYATYFGGSGDSPATDADFGNAIAIDAASPPNAYIAGQTFSSDLPVWPVAPASPVAFQTSLNGTSDAFVAKLALQPTLAISPLTLPFGSVVVGGNSTLPVTLTNNTGSTIPYTLAVTGTNAADFTAPAASSTCSASPLSSSSTPCTIGVTFKPSLTAAESANLTITYTVFGIQNSQIITLTGTGSATPVIGLSPGTLTFPGQEVTSTSTSQPVTLSNSGIAIPITISFTGADAGDYAETDTCAGMATNGCQISVTFKPTVTGTRTATLVVTPNPGTPQNVSLTGIGWDFGVSAPSTITVPRRKSGTLTLTVSQINGFSQAVSLACSGTIPEGTCTVSPTSVTPPGTTSATVTITTESSGMVNPLPMRVPRVPVRQVVPLCMALLLSLVFPVTRRLRMRLVLAGTVLILVLFAGCTGNPGTPKGNYDLTLTGTASGVTHSTAVTLTVD